MIGWTAVTIRNQRMNGLKFAAERESRTAAAMLDVILQRAGIPLLTDEELSQKLAELAAHERMRLKALEASISK
jgi:predicted solute-binding protein